METHTQVSSTKRYMTNLKTYISLDQDSSSHNGVDRTTQGQESCRQWKFISSRNIGLEYVFLLDIALLQCFAASLDEVGNVFVVPSGTNDSNPNFLSIQVTKGYFTFGGL